jgi:class 3 adenylate cyclase
MVPLSGWAGGVAVGTLGGPMTSLKLVLAPALSRASDRALVTVMMTDMVESTARAVAAGDRRWRALLERHDQTARAKIAAFSGRYVKSLGDGVLATFDCPTSAVGSARSLRSALAGLGLPVRSGFHTGEIELFDADIGGLTVNIAGRVCALAASDEILISASVRDFVDLSGATLCHRGAHQARGIPERWALYAID